MDLVMDFQYKYELHLHTKEGSACASLDGAAQARLYKSLGYDGVFITDHFFGGNTAVPRNLPWEQRIHLFCEGYRHAKEEGDRIRLKVFFGLETGFSGTEFLIYGVTEEWLAAQTDMMSWSIEEQYEHVHAAGGLVIHAHPFREASYIPQILLYPEHVDGVEVYNVENDRRDPKFNERALEYARKHHLPMTGGGDAHHQNSCHGGIRTEHPIESVEAFMELIRKGTEYQFI